MSYLLSAPLLPSIYPLRISVDSRLDEKTSASINNHLGNGTHEVRLCLSRRAVDVVVEVSGNQFTEGLVTFVLEALSSSTTENIKMRRSNR